MSAGKNKSTVKADIKNNRLLFTFNGWIVKKDLDGIYTDTRFCVADLRPGFHVITDFSACSFASLNCFSTFRKIMSFLMEKQPGQVVRITKKSSLVHKQIMNISARLQGYKPIYVTSLDEAMQVLSENTDSAGLRYVLHRVPVTFDGQESQETGMLVEISEQECVVECVSPSMEKNQEITLVFTLSINDSTNEEFSFAGRVSQVELDSFTVSLATLSDDEKARLLNALTRQSQRAPLLDEPFTGVDNM